MSRHHDAVILLVAAIVAIVVAGCQTTGSDPSPLRDTELASQLLAQAREYVERRELDQAAELLEQARAADPFDGRVRNNIGVIALQQGDLTLAAASFDATTRLLPGDPRPLINLGHALRDPVDSPMPPRPSSARWSLTPQVPRR